VGVNWSSTSITSTTRATGGLGQQIDERVLDARTAIVILERILAADPAYSDHQKSARDG
jgi:hypothetical protein